MALLLSQPGLPLNGNMMMSQVQQPRACQPGRPPGGVGILMVVTTQTQMAA
jgi:hypothetical protein